jgi:AcrR family transcriptional regulator
VSAGLPLPEVAGLKVDGRRARRNRSRELAVDALLDLLDAGEPRPTAQQVAERSGVSLRSIFRIFDDVETLHSEAAARQLARHGHLFVEVSAEGTLEVRIAQLVEVLDRLYNTVGPVRRAALRAAPDSAAQRDQLDRARSWTRGELERVFAAELARGDATLADAAEVALSFEAWDHCATAQRLAPEDRRAVLARLLHALLAGDR